MVFENLRMAVNSQSFHLSICFFHFLIDHFGKSIEQLDESSPTFSSQNDNFSEK